MRRLTAGALLAGVLAFVLLVSHLEAQANVLTFAWDGAAAAFIRIVSLSNFQVATTTTARPAVGAQIIERGSRWTVISAPASGTVGSASIAAEALTRHVVDCITFSADASAAVAAAAGTFVVRDGATGAGTVIATYRIAHQVAAAAGIQTIAPHSFCGLNLAGTTNTAMTAEFNAGVTGEEQAVTISGFNVQ